MNMIGNPTPMA